jgi:hypothetical protein
VARTVYLKRIGNALYPSDGLSDSDLSDIPSGKRIKAVITEPRRQKPHRLYWAVLKIVCENTEHPVLSDRDRLHDLVKIKCGCVHLVRSGKTGELFQLPGSIAFDKMDDAEFRAFLDKALAFLCDEVIPGLGVDDLEEQARQMVGERQENAA